MTTNQRLVLACWRFACHLNSDKDNEYHFGPFLQYRWNDPTVPAIDGAIIGTIERKHLLSSTWRRSGSWRVEEDGTVTRGTTFMKEAAKKVKPA